MAIHRMSAQEFDQTLRQVTQQMNSSANPSSGIDVKGLLENVQGCNEFILQNKNVTLPESVNKNIEKFLLAANVFIHQQAASKTTQERMGSLIAALSPITDDVQKLRNNLLRRRSVKKEPYGNRIEGIEKSMEFKKK